LSFNRSARRSETFRKGSPDSHENPVKFICDFIGRNMYQIFDQLVQVHAPFKTYWPREFIKKEKWDKWPGHHYDIGCTAGKIPKLIVEVGNIGDNSRHSNKEQKINDGIAFKFIQEYYPECRFFRINKDDSMYEFYLKKLLWKKSQ
jgi:hypothetical protein